MSDWWQAIEYQKCNEKSKRKILLYLQLNGGWWRPTLLAGNMTGVYWTTHYQLIKALDQLVKEGKLKCKLFEQGHFRYFAYRAKKSITIEEYRIEVEK